MMAQENGVYPMKRSRETKGVTSQAEGWAPAGDVFELYHIDNRHTARPEEFLTEIQLRVRRAEG